MYFQRSKKTVVSKFLSVTTAFLLVINFTVTPVMAQGVFNLPVPGTMVTPTPGYAPTLLKGIMLNPDNALQFEFIVDKGDEGLENQALRDESNKLIKYFMAALTVPENQLWVNLSPYEDNRIVSEKLGTTEMGRDMLAQDYMLKQLTASLMYPEDELGKEFWDRVHKKAFEKFGTTEVPMNTFNKIWIVPSKAVVYQNGPLAFVLDSHLDVMLEEDYVALAENLGSEKFSTENMMIDEAEVISGISSQVVKEVLIPEIEKEINEGQTFSNLRQIFHSMILATWFKQNLKESLLGQVYVDQGKTKGVHLKDLSENQQIFERYVEAFETGVYNYIKEDYDATTQSMIPRKYFSGGVDAMRVSSVVNVVTPQSLRGSDQAMITTAASDPSRYVGVDANMFSVGPAAQEDALNIPIRSISGITDKAMLTDTVASNIANRLARMRAAVFAGQSTGYLFDGNESVADSNANAIRERRVQVLDRVVEQLRAERGTAETSQALTDALARLNPSQDAAFIRDLKNEIRSAVMDQLNTIKVGVDNRVLSDANAGAQQSSVDRGNLSETINNRWDIIESAARRIIEDPNDIVNVLFDAQERLDPNYDGDQIAQLETLREIASSVEGRRERVDVDAAMLGRSVRIALTALTLLTAPLAAQAQRADIPAAEVKSYNRAVGIYNGFVQRGREIIALAKSGERQEAARQFKALIAEMEAARQTLGSDRLAPQLEGLITNTKINAKNVELDILYTEKNTVVQDYFADIQRAAAAFDAENWQQAIDIYNGILSTIDGRISEFEDESRLAEIELERADGTPIDGTYLTDQLRQMRRVAGVNLRAAQSNAGITDKAMLARSLRNLAVVLGSALYSQTGMAQEVPRYIDQLPPPIVKDITQDPGYTYTPTQIRPLPSIEDEGIVKILNLLLSSTSSLTELPITSSSRIEEQPLVDDLIADMEQRIINNLTADQIRILPWANMITRNYYYVAVQSRLLKMAINVLMARGEEVRPIIVPAVAEAMVRELNSGGVSSATLVLFGGAFQSMLDLNDFRPMMSAEAANAMRNLVAGLQTMVDADERKREFSQRTREDQSVAVEEALALWRETAPEHAELVGELSDPDIVFDGWIPETFKNPLTGGLSQVYVASPYSSADLAIMKRAEEFFNLRIIERGLLGEWLRVSYDDRIYKGDDYLIRNAEATKLFLEDYLSIIASGRVTDIHWYADPRNTATLGSVGGGYSADKTARARAKFFEERVFPGRDLNVPTLLDVEQMLGQIKMTSDRAMLSDNSGYFGVSVGERISFYQQQGLEFSVASTTTQRVERELDSVREYFRSISKSVPNVENLLVVENGSGNTTFGVGVTEMDGKSTIVVERSFVDEVLALNNPYDMLSRSLVYALNGESHEENKIAEYDYARQKFDNISEILAQTKGGANVEKLLAGFEADLFRDAAGKEDAMVQEIRTRLKQSLWEIGTNMLNRREGSNQSGRRVITSKTDNGYDLNDPQDGVEDVEIGVLAISANPEHWGHLETALRAMAQKQLDQVVIVVQGDDYRKPILAKTLEDRHEMIKMRVEGFGGLLTYSDWSKDNQNIGEESTEEMMLANDGRRGGITWHYIVGNDHHHYYAPDGNSKDAEGIRRNPKKGNGVNGYEPDTIQKLDNVIKTNEQWMIDNNVQLKVGSNIREWQDGVPLQEEVELLERLEQEGFIYTVPGVNLPNTSSTKLRKVLAGELPVTEASFMTKSVYDFIMERGKYRGLITELPEAVRRLVDDMNNVQKEDLARADANQLLKWLEIESSFEREYTPNDFYNMFFAQIQESEPDLYVTQQQVDEVFQFAQNVKDNTSVDRAMLVRDNSITSWTLNGATLEEVLTKIIKEYDIRAFDGFDPNGVQKAQIDEELLTWIGRVTGSIPFTSEEHGQTVQLKPGDDFVIAGDNGPSTQWVKDFIISGLRDAGINVIDLGGSKEGEATVTSGQLYSSISRLGAKGGLYVTRSHVEVGTNGIKPNIGGITLFGGMLTAIKDQILKGEYLRAETPGKIDNSNATRNSSRQMYYQAIAQEFAGLKESLEATGIKLSVNFSGGASVSYRDMFEDMLGDSLVRIIRAESDPYNERGGLADPSRKDAVALSNEKEDVIAYSKANPTEHIINFDLDADRISLVLDGRLYLGDELFYPIIEYMFTLDQYKDLNVQLPVWVDSRMMSTVGQMARHFGGVVKKGPKGHSKVKTVMDVMLRDFSKQQGYENFKAFLKDHPGFLNAQAEYSLHMFLTNENGEPFDDALRFAFFWLKAFTEVKQARGNTQWSYVDYVQSLIDDGIIAEPVQLKEQRTPIDENAKMEVMREMTKQVNAYFAGNNAFKFEANWRKTSDKEVDMDLVDIDGVFDLSTPIGDAFWGWSNTSPKIAIGAQSTDAEQTRFLTEVVTALYIHSREAVGLRLGLALPQLDDTETEGLRNMFEVANVAQVEDIVVGKYPTVESALSALSMASFGDKAMVTNANQAITTQSDEVGGIDLNPAMLDLQIKRDGNGVPLPLIQQPLDAMQIEGFIPVIINVAPINNLPFLLGANDLDNTETENARERNFYGDRKARLTLEMSEAAG